MALHLQLIAAAAAAAADLRVRSVAGSTSLFLLTEPPLLLCRLVLSRLLLLLLLLPWIFWLLSLLLPGLLPGLWLLLVLPELDSNGAVVCFDMLACPKAQLQQEDDLADGSWAALLLLLL